MVKYLVLVQAQNGDMAHPHMMAKTTYRPDRQGEKLYFIHTLMKNI